MLLLVVWFAILDVDDYFTLLAFQMAWLTLYVVWHAFFFTSDSNVHV
jgi:hypothetical protein